MGDFTLTAFTVLSKHVIVGYGLRSITVKAELSDRYSRRSLPVIGVGTEYVPHRLLGELAILDWSVGDLQCHKEYKQTRSTRT